jgi:hypothetical protein
MKGFFKLFSIASFLLLTWGIASASANDVYISQGGSGGANGSSCSNAYPASFFNSSANWGSGGTQIGPGTTAHLCGTIGTSLTVQGNGASGNPVTVLFEDGAKLSQPICNAMTGCLSLNGRSFVVVDGGNNGIIENTANGTGLANRGVSRGISAENCDNCEIRNLEIRNIYLRTSTSDNSFDQTGVTCIRFSGSNWQIHDNVMHDTGWCLNNFWQSGDTNVKIFNNEIYNIDHAYALAGASAGTASGFYFYNNHVHDFAKWDSGSANVFHHDGIHAFGVNGAKATDVWIYNNQFDGDIGANVTGYIFMEGGSGSGSTPWTDGSGVVRIFNNVFSAPNRTVYGLVQVHAGGNAQIFNNTISGSNASTCVDVSNGPSVSFQNNIVQNCNTLVYLHDGAKIATVDYNLYGNSNSNALVLNGNFLGLNALSSWKSACNCDLHSQVSNLVSNLLGPLTGGAAGVGDGANLSGIGIAALTRDKNGNPRPASPTPWDVGPFTSGSNVGPQPPTGLTATVQ